MATVESLRRLVPRRSVTLGDEYYRQGRVMEIGLDQDVIEAHVLGARDYSVVLELHRDRIRTRDTHLSDLYLSVVSTAARAV